MSHVVTIQTRLYDAAAVMAACLRLKLPLPVQGTARLYSAQATGLIVHLPQWRFPVVIDLPTGAVQYDNFGGRWGEPQHLNHFLQTYALEKVKIEARQRGYQVYEQPLADGSIQLQIRELAS